MHQQHQHDIGTAFDFQFRFRFLKFYFDFAILSHFHGLEADLSFSCYQKRGLFSQFTHPGISIYQQYTF